MKRRPAAKRKERNRIRLGVVPGATMPSGPMGERSSLRAAVRRIDAQSSATRYRLRTRCMRGILIASGSQDRSKPTPSPRPPPPQILLPSHPVLVRAWAGGTMRNCAGTCLFAKSGCGSTAHFWGLDCSHAFCPRISKASSHGPRECLAIRMTLVPVPDSIPTIAYRSMSTMPLVEALLARLGRCLYFDGP